MARMPVPNTDLMLEANAEQGVINIWAPCESPPGSCIVASMSVLTTLQLAAELQGLADRVSRGVGT